MKQADEKSVLKALENCVDPELGIDIVNLELVRGVEIKNGNVKIRMTMTTPFCPYGGMLLNQAQKIVESIEGVKKCKIELEFEPPWEPSKELKIRLGLA